jgi:L-malate glycosyltransferase
MKRILFITPSGGLTGSEIMLWYLLEQLTARGHEVALFSMERGLLHKRADTAAFPSVFYDQKHGFLPDFYTGLYRKAFRKLPVEQALLAFHQEFKPDLWYLNTVTLQQTAWFARQLGVPYVVHFHELLSFLDAYQAPPVQQMLDGAERLIGCSEIVCERVRQLGYPNVDKLYECIDIEQIRLTPGLNLRQQLGIPPDAFIWMMSGVASLRKGLDLVPDVVANLPDSAYFLWLGKDRGTALTLYVNNRIRQENLPIKMLGEQSTAYYDYLNLADGFALTSREDPFPLVMIEAAALGKPIVAFNSGGVSEFVQPGMGTVVNSLWPADLAVAMTGVMTGETAIDVDKLKNRAAEFDVKAFTDAWLRVFSH